MSSYIVWAANQAAAQISTWVAKNPAESSLIAAALANEKTRKFTLEVLYLIGREGIRSNVNIIRGIGAALTRNSVVANRTAAFARTVLQYAKNLAKRNPAATYATSYLALAVLTLALSRDEDPLTESLQVKGASHGWAGLGWPSIGSAGSGLVE